MEAFLCHPDPQLRYIALNVLTIHWGCAEHRKTCELFAQNDPDPDNRRMGVAGIGALLDGTRDALALAFLLGVFRNAREEDTVREAAYSSVLYVLGAPVSEQPPLTRRLDFANAVDLGRLGEAERIATGG